MILNRWIFNWNIELQKIMKSYAEYYEAVFTGCGKIKLGGGPQRLDHLSGELSYSQKLDKL
jgi:hypothetical protein